MTGSSTTDTELRDLLASEAGGPSGAPGGWDDVVRRGHHRQRMRRAQRLGAVLLVAGVAATAVALSDGDASVDTGPPASDPTTVVPDPTSTSTTTSATAAIPPGATTISAGRAQGAFLTVVIPAADPTTGYDPCVALHPRTAESADQIGIELIGEDIERGRPWAACQSSAFSAWGTIELLEPFGGQPVLDLTTGDEITVIDGGPLLFPTQLPEPFDIERWDEFGPDANRGDWTFSWSAEDVFVSVTTSSAEYGGCDEPIEVRGVTGCREGSDGVYLVRWEEGGRQRYIEMGVVDQMDSTTFTIDDVLAVAEGLEFLSGG